MFIKLNMESAFESGMNVVIISWVNLWVLQDAQTHRDHYKDHSGLTQLVPGIRARRHSAPPGTRYSTKSNTHKNSMHSISQCQLNVINHLGCFFFCTFVATCYIILWEIAFSSIHMQFIPLLV